MWLSISGTLIIISKQASSPTIRPLLNWRWTSSAVSGMVRCARSANENNIVLIQSRRFDYSKHSSSKRNNGMILYRIIIFCACAHEWHSLSLTLYQI